MKPSKRLIFYWVTAKVHAQFLYMAEACTFHSADVSFIIILTDSYLNTSRVNRTFKKSLFKLFL